MRTTRSVMVRFLLSLAAALAVVTANADAQLVYDGTTNFVAGGSNTLSSGLTVGRFLPSTDLRMSSGAVLKIPVGAPFTVGENYGSDGNQVIVSGSTSVLYVSGRNYIGFHGSRNSVLVTNGAFVEGFVSGYSLYDTVLGYDTNSYENQITVTGANSEWRTTEVLFVNGVSNKVLIAKGGRMTGNFGFHGAVYSIGSSVGADNNQFILTDQNSKCAAVGATGEGLFVLVGEAGANNSLLVSNSATLTAYGIIGSGTMAHNNSATVSGSNSVWQSSASLSIGLNGASNSLLVEKSGAVKMASIVVGSEITAIDNLLAVISGIVTTTNSSKSGVLDVRRGSLLFTGGSINADQLLLTNGIAGIMRFNSGTLQTLGLTNHNSNVFAVGDGTNRATLILGGTNGHVFANGLLIQTNATLTGTGTINGSVTNYGTIFLTNADQLIFTGPVVNKGVIIAVTGTPRFGSTFTNLGTLITTASINVANVSVSGLDIVLQFNSVSNYLHEVQASTNVSSGVWQTLTNGLLGTGSPMTFTDPGGALSPNRTYRVLLH